jgi:hypothetical protein
MICRVYELLCGLCVAVVNKVFSVLSMMKSIGG